MSDEPSAVSVVLSAERAAVSTRRVPVERVRVRREVITEDVTVTVTVTARREVLRMEREALTDLIDPTDLTDTDAGGGGLDLAGGADPADAPVWEVLLSAERPVVSLQVVPYERVRIGVQTVGTTTAVGVELGREVAEVVTETTVDR